MIDAHQHFWELGRHDCTWPAPDLVRLYRDYVPEHLAPLITAAEIRGTVLVQSQPSHRDTDYLCEVAARTEWVLAVVGWADLVATDAPARIAQLASRPKLAGLRPMLQHLADDSMLDPEWEPAIRAMLKHGLSFDALVRPRHLRSLRQFAERHPGLPIVIDHAAKPDIARGEIDPWRDDMRSIAELPNVFCKFSGLVTEADMEWQPDDLAPYCMHLLDCFGPERLMWGSDWPVLELRTDYARWLETAQGLLRHLGTQEQAAVFQGTAAHFYKTKT